MLSLLLSNETGHAGRRGRGRNVYLSTFWDFVGILEDEFIWIASSACLIVAGAAVPPATSPVLVLQLTTEAIGRDDGRGVICFWYGNCILLVSSLGVWTAMISVCVEMAALLCLEEAGESIRLRISCMELCSFWTCFWERVSGLVEFDHRTAKNSKRVVWKIFA